MKRLHLELMREWFAGFTRAFYARNAEEQKNIALKEEHTRQVCANMARIARDEGLDGERTALAEAIALFHDIGRFPQYRRYGTFKDSASVDHGCLGAATVFGSGVLDKLPRNEQLIISACVRHHNALAVPTELDPETAFFLNMVRDADKLDIWRVFIEFYSLPEGERASAVGLGLADEPACSEEILAAVRRGEMARLAQVKSLNDFKLLQLSWVYDLNFAASFRMLDDRGSIDRLAATLPDRPDVEAAVSVVREFVHRRA